MPNDRIQKTKSYFKLTNLSIFGVFEHSYFGFVSDFGIRISNLSHETYLLTPDSIRIASAELVV